MSCPAIIHCLMGMAHRVDSGRPSAARARQVLRVAILAVLGLSIALPGTGCAQDWQRRLAEAMERLRAGDPAAVAQLQRESRRALLPHLSAYVNDPDPRLRRSLIGFVRGLHTAQELTILTALVAQDDAAIAREATRTIFADFDCGTIRAAGAALQRTLQDALIKQLSDQGPVEALALLGCFDGSRKLKQELLWRIHRARVLLPVRVGLETAANLALAEIGVEQGRLMLLFFIRHPESFGDAVATLLQLIKFIRDRRTLEQLLTLIEDVHPLKRSPPARGPRLRVCDVAIEAWLKKLHLDYRAELQLPVGAQRLARRLKDSELKRLRTLIVERYHAWERAQPTASPGPRRTAHGKGP